MFMLDSRSLICVDITAQCNYTALHTHTSVFGLDDYTSAQVEGGQSNAENYINVTKLSIEHRLYTPT